MINSEQISIDTRRIENGGYYQVKGRLWLEYSHCTMEGSGHNMQICERRVKEVIMNTIYGDIYRELCKIQSELYGYRSFDDGHQQLVVNLIQDLKDRLVVNEKHEPPKQDAVRGS